MAETFHDADGVGLTVRSAGIGRGRVLELYVHHNPTQLDHTGVRALRDALTRALAGPLRLGPAEAAAWLREGLRVSVARLDETAPLGPQGLTAGGLAALFVEMERAFDLDLEGLVSEPRFDLDCCTFVTLLNFLCARLEATHG